MVESKVSLRHDKSFASEISIETLSLCIVDLPLPVLGAPYAEQLQPKSAPGDPGRRSSTSSEVLLSVAVCSPVAHAMKKQAQALGK